MANRDFKDVQALERELKIIAGRVTVSSGSCTVADGAGFTVGNFSTGVVIITLDDKYSGLLHAGATLNIAGADDDDFMRLKAHDVTSAKTVTFAAHDTAGTADATPADGEFTFMLLLKNSSVT